MYRFYIFNIMHKMIIHFLAYEEYLIIIPIQTPKFLVLTQIQSPIFLLNV